MKWNVSDGNADLVIEAETAAGAAQEYVDDGDWGPVEETTWISVSVWPEGDEDRENVTHHTIRIDPPEPECVDGEGHHWKSPHRILGGDKSNPGVWGHGGGVVIYEVCMRCGCGKVTDTWAQDPCTGEQGLESVNYQPEKYSDAIKAESD